MTLMCAALMCAVPGTAGARNTTYMLPIDAALGSSAARERLGDTVAFYFGNQSHPPIARQIGEWVTNLKTNAFNKSDHEACEWVFLGALISLRDRAVKEGGDAVVGIRSFYRKNEVVSDTEYECHAGAVIAGVALKGTVVKLAR
jgi:uncharacterized protein YbjQ (UPF0145 family)